MEIPLHTINVIFSPNWKKNKEITNEKQQQKYDEIDEREDFMDMDNVSKRQAKDNNNNNWERKKRDLKK